MWKKWKKKERKNSKKKYIASTHEFEYINIHVCVFEVIIDATIIPHQIPIIKYKNLIFLLFLEYIHLIEDKNI